MKIGYLANVRFPSERAHAAQIAYTCQAFCEHGATVELIVNTRSDASKERIDTYFNIDSKFLLRRLPYGIFLPKVRLAFYLSELFFALAFIIRFGTKKYDIYFSRSEWIVWCLRFFIPAHLLVWESHEAKLNYPARRLLKSKALIVVISEGIYDTYKQYGVDPTRMVVAHDGIDESFFAVVESKEVARHRLQLSQTETIAMYIGGFDQWKGVETFFAASNLCVDTRFVAIGGNGTEILQFSKTYPRVQFLGHKPYSELKNNQQAADVLVVPNSNKTKLSSHYTSPLKLFAHMASGIPLVASNIPSIKRITGDTHITLVEPDSPEALAAGISSVCSALENKRASAQQMITLAQNYTWNERAKRILLKIHAQQ